jgi:hypothetical protein
MLDHLLICKDNLPLFFSPSFLASGGGKLLFAPWPYQQRHRIASHLLPLGCLRIPFRFLGSRPTEECHQLMLGSSVLCGDGRPSLSQAVRPALGQSGFIAPGSKKVAESTDGEKDACDR